MESDLAVWNGAMDISGEIRRRSGAGKRKKWWMGAGFGAVVLVLGGFWLIRDSGASPDVRNSVRLELKRGDMPLNVLGYGRLKSKDERFLASPLQGTVEEILVHPGEAVTKDTVVLRLSNSEIEGRVAAARAALAEAGFALKQRQAEQSSEITSSEVELAELEADLAGANVRQEAERLALEAGVISAVNFKATEFEVQKLKRVIALRRQQHERLRRGHAEDLKARHGLVEQLQVSLDVQLAIVDSMRVTARMNGVLKSLAVSPGQAVEAGHRLADVGGVDSLTAELFIAQRESTSVKSGAPVKISTDGGVIKGRVDRIDPVVADGRVRVEMALEAPLPANAKPELAVQGTIETGRLRNVVYVRQPPGVIANSKREVVLFPAGSDDEERRMLEFGAVSGGYAQVLKGASAGDSMVLVPNQPTTSSN